MDTKWKNNDTGALVSICLLVLLVVLYLGLMPKFRLENTDQTEPFYRRESFLTGILDGCDTVYENLMNGQNAEEQQEFLETVDFQIAEYQHNLSGSNADYDFLTPLRYGKSFSDSMEKAYAYAAALHFDVDGGMSVLGVWLPGGEDTEAAEAALEAHWQSRAGPGQETPRNCTVGFAVPVNSRIVQEQYTYQEEMLRWRRNFRYFWIGLLVLAAVCGALVGLFGLLQLDFPNGYGIPVEILLCLVIPVLWFGEQDMARLACDMQTGVLAEHWQELLNIGNLTAEVLACLWNLLVCFLLLGCIYFSCVSLMQVFRMNPKEYWKRHSWLYLLARYWKRRNRKCYQMTGSIGLDVQGEAQLVSVFGKYTFQLIFLSVLWMVGGVLPAILCGCAAYIILRKRYEKIRRDYQKLVSSVKNMADGNLNAEISGRNSIFRELSRELEQVQAGFQKAVETEVQSRNMKTELITNVSHDLKTPLTAIITYIDLLRDETLTAEQRREYLDTLDRKSQRLKGLIADLFEISRAASGSMELHTETLDFCALLRQVKSELSDRLEESPVDFRWNLPEERVMLRLDGERTFRILENLLVNIVKYGMPGTRAYIDLEDSGDAVSVSMKNISAAELTASGENLTERFVRGDKSRNTEGSGLGLAIARSFTEMQGGNFSISVDGDLFKAEVQFPRNQ